MSAALVELRELRVVVSLLPFPFPFPLSGLFMVAFFQGAVTPEMRPRSEGRGAGGGATPPANLAVSSRTLWLNPWYPALQASCLSVNGPRAASWVSLARAILPSDLDRHALRVEQVCKRKQPIAQYSERTGRSS